MMDVIALSELSDEPVVGDLHASPMRWDDFSPRLAAVLERMPNNSTGTATRVRGGLRNAGIFTLAALRSADNYILGRKHLGPTSRAAIDAALACFGLHRLGENPPTVVRDGATAFEANAQRLQDWIAKRIEECVAELDRRGAAGASHQTTEQEVLTDVMLILDGREPLNKRHWFGCRGDIDCEREYGHDGPHRQTTVIDGVEETEAWP